MNKVSKILTAYPQGKRGVNIDASKYDCIRIALLESLQGKELNHPELTKAVEARVPNSFAGSVAWYAEVVTLDLEAKKEIVRTSHRPARYKIFQH